MGYKRKISTNVYRSLLSRSGNQCAFPGCTDSIFSASHKLISQLCHIEPVGEKEVRYNPNLTDEIVNDYDNLLFLCYQHHVETNDDQVFTVPVLKKIKYDHEEQFINSPYLIDVSHFFQIIQDIDNYWNKVAQANTEDHDIPDLRIEIDTQANYETLKSEILSSLNSIESLLTIIQEDNKNKYWEIFNIGIPNYTNKIRVMIDHSEIKYLEEFVKSNPDNQRAKGRLEELRRDFLEQAKSASLID